MDSNRIDCLVETGGFGVEPRRECPVIKMGFTLIDLCALCFRACDPTHFMPTFVFQKSFH